MECAMADGGEDGQANNLCKMHKHFAPPLEDGLAARWLGAARKAPAALEASFLAGTFDPEEA